MAGGQLLVLALAHGFTLHLFTWQALFQMRYAHGATGSNNHFLDERMFQSAPKQAARWVEMGSYWVRF